MRPLGDLFNPNDFPALLVGLSQPDDAAVYRLNESQAVISTVDFFPPVVDDSYQFGAIAAANALSDVYAMGGEPVFALNLVGWPDELPAGMLSEILRGAAEKVREAGAVIAGGHTVSDREPKFGLAVTGLVAPGHFWTKAGAQPGDALILTKALGTGTITTALKRGLAQNSHVDACIASMSTLNRAAAKAAKTLGSAIHAVTDITGFGLVGHAHEMGHLSGCGLAFEYSVLPWLSGVETYAREWIFPGGTERNEHFYSAWTQVDRGLEDWQRQLLFDPQTSGGLLLALDPAYADAFLDACPAWRIGVAETAPAGRVRIV